MWLAYLESTVCWILHRNLICVNTGGSNPIKKVLGSVDSWILSHWSWMYGNTYLIGNRISLQMTESVTLVPNQLLNKD